MSVIWWLDEQFLGKEELICKTECHVCEYVSNIRTHCATGYCEGKKQIWNIRRLSAMSSGTHGGEKICWKF